MRGRAWGITVIYLLFISFIIVKCRQISMKRINIHIIPHSHVDPMWKASPHEYSKITRSILEGVVLSLIDNSNRTFIWESIFFLDLYLHSHGRMSICDVYSNQRNRELLKDWCNLESNSREINPEIVSNKCCTMKEAFAQLLSNGQLEFVGGGWVSHDETLTDYESKLDNYMIGRRWIAKEFGTRSLLISVYLTVFM